MFIALTVAACLALAAAAPSYGQMHFVFAPHWSAQAQFAGYYVAKEKGFYEGAGLDVQIVHPFSTQTLEEQLRSGEIDAICMFLSEAIVLTDNGADLVNILQTSMNSSLAIVSRFGSNPLTMHGAKVLIWHAGFDQIPRCLDFKEQLYYDWVEASSTVNLFVSGAVDATMVTSYNEYYQLLSTGIVNPGSGIFRFAENGYNIQEDGVYMTAENYARKSIEADRFAHATRLGWEWTASHPEEALDIVMKYVKEFRIPSNRVLQQRMLEEVLRLQLDPNSGQRSFTLRPDMVGRASDLMLEAGIISRDVRYEEFLK